MASRPARFVFIGVVAVLLFSASPVSAACVDASGGGAGVNGGCVSGSGSSDTSSTTETRTKLPFGDVKETINELSP